MPVSRYAPSVSAIHRGGVIPDSRSSDGKYRDASGRTVYSKLNPDSLEQLAQAGRGSYLPPLPAQTTPSAKPSHFWKVINNRGETSSLLRRSTTGSCFPAIVLLALSLVIRSNLFRPRIASPAAALLAMVLLLA